MDKSLEQQAAEIANISNEKVCNIFGLHTGDCNFLWRKYKWKSDQYLKLLKKYQNEIQDLKSSSDELKEDDPECLPSDMFDRGEDEVSYLRGLIDSLLKDRQNVKTN